MRRNRGDTADLRPSKPRGHAIAKKVRGLPKKEGPLKEGSKRAPIAWFYPSQGPPGGRLQGPPVWITVRLLHIVKVSPRR